jgi:twinkle protein
MGLFIHHRGCEGCGSSDANGIYEDTKGGFNSYCFACETSYSPVSIDGKRLKAVKKDDFELDGLDTPPDITTEVIEYLPSLGLRDRGLVKNVANFYGLKVAKRGFDDIVTHHYYPYYRKGKLVGYQQRKVEDKSFSCIGYCKNNVELQGRHLFENNNKTVVITEGFLDMLAASQMMYGKGDGKRYPVVSLPNGASDRAVVNNLDWLNRFEKVILMLDQDEPGRKASEKIAKILQPGKAYIATFSEKDPCDMLKAGKEEEFKGAYWGANKYSPADILTACDVREVLVQQDVESIPYPDFASKLNMYWYGKRLGEIELYIAGTGLGKSSWFKEDWYHMLTTTEEKLGIISLEESPRDVFIGMQSLHMNKRMQLPDVVVSETEREDSLVWLEKDIGERLVVLDHQGSSVDEDLIDKIRYMAAIGCKYIYLDHITIAVSESEHTNLAIDKFMSDVLKMVKSLNIWLGVVSHLRKTQAGGKSFEEGAIPSEDDIKGSGSLKQVPFNTIAFARNKMAKDPIKRNTTSIYVLKSRLTGRTGFAGKFIFDEKTGRLEEHDENDLDIEENGEDSEFEFN